MNTAQPRKAKENPVRPNRPSQGPGRRASVSPTTIGAPTLISTCPPTQVSTALQPMPRNDAACTMVDQSSMSSRRGVNSDRSITVGMAIPNASASSSRPRQPRPVRTEISRMSSAAPP